MVDGQFRVRADTGYTADSKDSGIEIRPRFRNKRVVRSENPHVSVIREYSEEKWDIDTILWTIVFMMTLWFFRLPMSIWFSPKVDWYFIMLSVFSFVIFSSCGFWMYLKHRSTLRWHILSPFTFAIAWIAFGCSVISFSVSTWDLFGWWSLYIVGVTLMFSISIAPLFP